MPGKLILAAAAFAGAYYGTERFFERYTLPYPHELCGIAAGLAAACWVGAFFSLFKSK